MILSGSAPGDTPGKARLRLIDFGAAADLRVGINYAPKARLTESIAFHRVE